MSGVWKNPGDDEYIMYYEYMVRSLKSGKKVVIGTDEQLHVGSPIIRIAGIVVVELAQRSTRSDFVNNSLDPDAWKMIPAVPFYWECTVYGLSRSADPLQPCKPADRTEAEPSTDGGSK